MLAGWRVFSLIAISALFAFEEWASTPSCKLILNDAEAVAYGEKSEELKVMMVANLLLLGPDADYVNHFFREYYMSKFFRVLPLF